MVLTTPDKKVKSPLTGSPHCEIVRSYDYKRIIEKYKDAFGIDTSKYFAGTNILHLYQCPDTGYQFYYPFSLAGDGTFYEQLQKFDWYYMPWKWEHTKALKNLQKSDKILEVGSGGGGFLRHLSKKGYDVTGLELNDDAVQKCMSIDLNVFCQSVEEHAVSHAGLYDVVCSFQVLEHIAHVHSFIEANIKCLKPGGKLIICVPNNNSFIRLDKFLFLNMPPHHMGLWDGNSLKKLSEIYPLSLIKLIKEPLQSYHLDWYLSLKEQQPSQLRSFYFNRMAGKKLNRKFLKHFSRFIIGHSIMVVFKKK